VNSFDALRMHRILQQCNVTIDIHTQWTGPPIVLLCLYLISPKNDVYCPNRGGGGKKEGHYSLPLHCNFVHATRRPLEVDSIQHTAICPQPPSVWASHVRVIKVKNIKCRPMGRRSMGRLKKNKIFNETETRNIAHPTNFKW